MATTCSTIITAARNYSPLNTNLTSDPVEMLTRLGQIQARIFSAIAEVSKDRFQVSATLASSSESSARVLTLSGLAVPLERLLTLTVPTGRARLVDPQDVDAEYAPRYLSRAGTLVEVGSDWTTTTGAVTATLVYVRAPTAITATGGTAQTISLPDEWVDLLIKPLAMYLFSKDPGRDPAEYTRLQAEYEADWQAIVASMTHASGRASVGQFLPAPAVMEKR